jgi:hypothetical protein
MRSLQPQRNDVLLRVAANPKILDEWSASVPGARLKSGTTGASNEDSSLAFPCF